MKTTSCTLGHNQTGPRAILLTILTSCLMLGNASKVRAIDLSAMVAAYSFDDGTAKDDSGNGLDGTLVGGPVPVEGRVNGGLEFDGTDGVHVVTPDLGEVDELTIATWFKMTGRVDGWRVFYNVDGWSAGWVHHQLHLNNKIEFSIRSNTGGNDTFGDTIFDDAKLDEWHHSAVVYSSSERTIKFYVDGELDGERDWGGNPAVLGPAEIGAWNNGGRGFEGVLDEFIILNIAATPEQVKALASGNSVFDNSDPNAGGFGEAVNFGRVPILGTDQDLAFNIVNTGAENTLTLEGFALSGRDAGFFTLEETPAEVAPKSTGVVKLTFNSKGELRPFEAILEFSTNDPDEEDQNISLPLRVIVNNPDAPLVHYRLDETDDAAEATDDTGDGRHGTYRTDVGSLTLGHPGLAENTGTSIAVAGGEIQSADGFIADLGSFSITLWMNLSSLAGVDGQAFGTIVGLGVTSPQFALITAEGDVRWLAEGDEVLFRSNTQPIEIGTSHHVAIILDEEANRGRVLIDAEEVASGEVPSFDGQGSLYFGAFGPGALGMEGRLDDIQIYDRAITDDNVNWLRANPGKVLVNTIGDGDGDGLPDIDEVTVHGTDPLLVDTDGDGLSDGDEILRHRTNPLSVDTDDDGFLDGFEVEGGHDPLDATKPDIADLLLVHYDFEEGSGTSAANQGNKGGPGTVRNLEKGEWRASGSPSKSGAGYLYFDGEGGGASAMHVETGLGADALGISGENDYTAMAWINLANTAGDNMVFGQAVDGEVLHHGTRDTSYYMGHWGADTGGGTAVAEEWHHVAFRYEDGVQSIIVDGEEVASGRQRALNVNANVVIGTTRGADDRDFHGGIDEVRIYNTALSDRAIQKILQGETGPPPAPSVLPVIGSLDFGPNRFRLQFTGAEGVSYDIEHSEDLIHWTVISSELSGEITFEDTDAVRTNGPSGFYRGVQK